MENSSPELKLSQVSSFRFQISYEEGGDSYLNKSSVGFQTRSLNRSIEARPCPFFSPLL